MAGVTSEAVVNAIHSEKGGILYEDTQGEGGHPILGPRFFNGSIKNRPFRDQQILYISTASLQDGPAKHCVQRVLSAQRGFRLVCQLNLQFANKRRPLCAI